MSHLESGKLVIPRELIMWVWSVHMYPCCQFAISNGYAPLSFIFNSSVIIILDIGRNDGTRAMFHDKVADMGQALECLCLKAF